MGLLSAIGRMPTYKAVGVSVVISFTLSGMLMSWHSTKTKNIRTLNKEWEDANLAYRRHYNMDPIRADKSTWPSPKEFKPRELPTDN